MSSALAPLASHGSLGMVFGGLGKPGRGRAGKCSLSSVYNTMSTMKAKYKGPKVGHVAFNHLHASFCTPSFIINIDRF